MARRSRPSKDRFLSISRRAFVVAGGALLAALQWPPANKRNKRQSTSTSAMRHHFFAGSRSGAGKNLIICGLMRLAQQHAVKTQPFKPFAIDVGNSRLGSSPYTPSIDYQLLASGSHPSNSHNPIYFHYKHECDLEPDIYLEGQLRTLPSDAAERRAMFQAAIERSILAAQAEGGMLMVEGSGNLTDALDYDWFQAYTIERLDACVHLIVNCKDGGGFASAVGTLELMPATLRSRVTSIFLNQYSGTLSDPISERFRNIVQSRYGVDRIFVVPSFMSVSAINEDRKLCLEDQASLETELDFIAQCLCDCIDTSMFFGLPRAWQEKGA